MANPAEKGSVVTEKNGTLIASERIQRLNERNHELAVSGKRDLLVDNAEFLVYHWSGESAAFTPATGESAHDHAINIGDHNCRVDIGGEFPAADQLPSRVDGYEMNATNWARDYSFFLDHSPAEVHPDELIVGEFHWQLDEARRFKYPQDQLDLGLEARKLGAGGISFTHTCPDLSIGLERGWTVLTEEAAERARVFRDAGNIDSADYLDAMVVVGKAVSRFILRHAETAERLASEATNTEEQARYNRVAENCRAIATDRPRTLYQAIQWIQFFLVAERLHGHGNGYGRLDQLLQPFYVADMAAGRTTREEARELVAEIYLKYGGNYWSFGGRDVDGRDATVEMSWVALEAYDITGGYNHLGLMWHKDIDPDFFRYGCEVVARHGAGTPTLVNYDVMRDSQLRSGVLPEHAWNIAYAGCQWYCVIGREYNDQDLNSLVLVEPMKRAIDRGVAQNVQSFDDFWALYDEEVNKTADVLRDFKNKTYEYQHKVWPEMVTSFCMHGPVNVGRDVTDIRAVDYNYTSVNVLGTPNVADSLYAIKRAVFDDQRYTLAEIRDGMEHDWSDREPMRQYLLSLPKFGNDQEEPDEMAIAVSEHVREVLESRRNIKGFCLRPSLFQFMGHTYAGPIVGATPDGRLSSEPLAHGMNPMHGRNTEGISATAHSFCKLDFTKYQGGSFQIELDPSFFPADYPRSTYVQAFALSFFQLGGVQINLNVVDLAQLRRAMDHPEEPQFRNLVVKVTGYSAHFVNMDRKLQEEFLQRVNYATL
jgi:formate C-acetyltransferase